jgi:hypothetical protein
MLIKTLGVTQVIVLINSESCVMCACVPRSHFVVRTEMDDPTVQWSKDRYDECVKYLTTFLKTLGYTSGKGALLLRSQFTARDDDNVCVVSSAPTHRLLLHTWLGSHRRQRYQAGECQGLSVLRGEGCVHC